LAGSDRVISAIAGIHNPGIMDSVKTTIDIPDETLKRTMRFTGAKTKKEAVVMALECDKHFAMICKVLAD
jgi:hypothetical protein